MTEARTKLLVQIFAVLGVSAVACGKGSVVAPDKPGDDASACPADKGHYAEWPDGKRPSMMDGANDVCLAKPAGKACDATPAKCVLKNYQCGFITGGKEVVDTLPTKEPDTCCWKVKGDCAVGRPFIVNGAARVAALTSGDGWNLAAIELAIDGLEPGTRSAIANVWARDALTEHASVASFAQLVLELLAVGAPAALVIGAQEAMGDEIRHAQRAFTLASIYAGGAVAPDKLPTHGAMLAAPTLADFAARTASEGCIAESIAALQLHAAAEATTNSVIASLLRQTAEEESAHSLLAYRIVAWAIAKGGEEVRVAVKRVFDDAANHIGFGPLATLDLRAHGILSRRERHDLAVTALRDVIAPACEALLHGSAIAPLCT